MKFALSIVAIVMISAFVSTACSLLLHKTVPSVEQKANELVEKHVDIFMKFAKENKNYDIDYELTIVMSEYNDSYHGILLLTSKYEAEIFFIHSDLYFQKMLKELEQQMNGQDYDYSWNLFLMNVKKELFKMKPIDKF